MNRDNIFEDRAPRGSDFKFDADVAAVFDNMISRSVPFYAEQQRMIVEVVKRYWRPGSAIYDLGCATGTTLISLGRELDGSGRLVGYDNSDAMLQQAQGAVAAEGLGHCVELRLGDLERDAQTLRLDNAGVVLMCWTLQFVRPLQREALLSHIHESLADGGLLVVTEKVLSNARDLDPDFIDFYYAFKTQTGYSQTEIHRKRTALENVLVPYRIDENKERWRVYQAEKRRYLIPGVGPKTTLYFHDRGPQILREGRALRREAKRLDSRCGPYLDTEADDDFIAFMRTAQYA
jgi:tRNA (cmo5U34)-methyltransferase